MINSAGLARTEYPFLGLYHSSHNFQSIHCPTKERKNDDHLSVMSELHPDLWLMHYLPSLPLDITPSWVINFTRNLKGGKAPSDITIQDLVAPSTNRSDLSVRLRVYSPAGSAAGAEALPAMLWFHGGGYVIGTHRMGQDANCERVRQLGIRVVSVEYRLAPEDPAPAGNDDAFAAWVYLTENAGKLGIDPTKVVVGGQSAGAGIAAGLCQRVYDYGGIQPISQYLLYPMLDDRTVLKEDTLRYSWTTRNNHYAWRAYLSQDPGLATVPSPYAVPGRREDLSGLPPAYITVGSIDLFHEENEDYAKKLEKAGIRARFETIAGGSHAFEVMPWFKDTALGVRYRGMQIAALASAFKAFEEHV
jgi:acetyl esterase/lipase